MIRRVAAPDGTVWTVRRRPEPEADEVELRARYARGWQGWAITVAFAAALLAAFVWSPWALAALVVAAVALELAARVRQLRRPWLVEATASGPERELAWRVSGFRRSRALAAEVVRTLERGQTDVDLPGAERL